MRTATCVICGAAFETNHPTKKTCSPTCCGELAKLCRRRWYREHCRDFAFRVKESARYREYYEKRRYDLEWHERRSEQAREYYRRKHEHD